MMIGTRDTEPAAAVTLAGGLTVQPALPDARRPVMVVAADPAMREHLASELVGVGLMVVRAASVDDALAMLEERRPRAIVVSTKLPGTNWAVLAARARTQHGATVVVLTRDDAWQRAKAHVLGCDVLQRPVDLDALLELVSAPREGAG